MSAEKEIVNYWYNKQGFFTINNIKTTSNRDAGILALKFKKQNLEEIQHIEISCSITGVIDLNKEKIDNFINDKFNEESIQGTINCYIKQMSVPNIKKIVVLSNLPKSKKKEIIKTFKSKNIEVLEFEDILSNMIQNLDTQYYKNDIIRTLQLMKFLLLTEPVKLAEMGLNLNLGSKQEFLRSILDQEWIVKEFRKTNEERLANILKHYTLKNPAKLAELLENSILNRKTRKPFLASLLEHEKMKKIYKKETKKVKLEKPLNKFF
jgi:ribosomal protein L30E